MEFMKTWKILVINISDCRLNGGDTQKTHRNDDFTWSGVEPITNSYSWTGIHQTPRHSTEHLEKRFIMLNMKQIPRMATFTNSYSTANNPYSEKRNLISLRGWMAS